MLLMIFDPVAAHLRRRQDAISGGLVPVDAMCTMVSEIEDAMVAIWISWRTATS